MSNNSPNNPQDERGRRVIPFGESPIKFKEFNDFTKLQRQLELDPLPSTLIIGTEISLVGDDMARLVYLTKEEEKRKKEEKVEEASKEVIKVALSIKPPEEIEERIEEIIRTYDELGNLIERVRVVLRRVGRRGF